MSKLERQLKAECHRELELILDMEESFVYADHPLYKDALKQTKTHHRNESSASAVHHDHDVRKGSITSAFQHQFCISVRQAKEWRNQRRQR